VPKRGIAVFAAVRKLSRRLNEVMKKFREVRAGREARLQYFEVIVQCIGTVTFRPDVSLLPLYIAGPEKGSYHNLYNRTYL